MRSPGITWQGCDLRKWLNGAFYHAAFDPSEMKRIQTVRCTDNGESCPDMKDRVFLLSATEAREMKDPLFRRAAATDFSRGKRPDSCNLYVYDKTNPIDSGHSWWWLRAQGSTPSRAFFIGTRGSIRGYCRVNLGSYGVRLALRLDHITDKQYLANFFQRTSILSKCSVVYWRGR